MYPRIAIAPKVLAAFEDGNLPRAWGHSISYERKFIRGLLTQGDDGVWFIDYLRAFESETDGPAEYVQWLNDHAETVRSIPVSKAESRALSSVAMKKNWLAKYHNGAVADYADALQPLGLEVEELLVTAESVSTLFEFKGKKDAGS